MRFIFCICFVFFILCSHFFCCSYTHYISIYHFPVFQVDRQCMVSHYQMILFELRFGTMSEAARQIRVLSHLCGSGLNSLNGVGGFLDTGCNPTSSVLYRLPAFMKVKCDGNRWITCPFEIFKISLLFMFYILILINILGLLRKCLDFGVGVIQPIPCDLRTNLWVSLWIPWRESLVHLVMADQCQPNKRSLRHITRLLMHYQPMISTLPLLH